MRVSVVVAVREPEVPVMVNVVVPRAAALLAVRVRTLNPVVGFVPQDAVTPLGRAEVTARVTLPVKPYCGVTVMADVAEEPWPMVRAAGEAASVKLCG